MSLRYERAGIVLLAAIGLAGCFGSREPLITPQQSQKVFGDKGAAKRIEIGKMYGAQQRITFAWAGDGYVLTDGKGRKEPVSYRMTDLKENWWLTQKSEGGVAAYGLARRDENRLWTYSPECRDLTDSDRAALDLTIQADGTCWTNSAHQLKEAMKKLIFRGIKPDGYYELEAAAK